MQEVIDAINSDHFGTTSLTDSFTDLPVNPNRLGQLNIFNETDSKANLRTTTVVVEERKGRLKLIAPQARGVRNNKRESVKPRARRFGIPHFPYEDIIQADDLQNIRPYGEESMLDAVAVEMNDRLEGLKEDHEFTQEHLRVGALKGNMIGGDGEVIYNWNTEFNIPQVALTLDIGGASPGSLKMTFHDIQRRIKKVLGNMGFKQFYGFCGANFMDLLSTAPELENAYQRYLDGVILREGQAIKTLDYADMSIEEYWGHVDDSPFFADNECYFFPLGARGMFQRYNAPANFMETVNTKAKPGYAKRRMMDFDTGVELHTQANCLFLNRLPGAVVKLTLTKS